MERDLAGIFVLVFLLGVLLGSLQRSSRRRSRGNYRPNPRYRQGAGWQGENHKAAPVVEIVDHHESRTVKQNLADPRDQMAAIARVGFEPVPLLNRSEARLLPLLESVVRKLNAGHRVMAQTALGEVIRTAAGAASKEEQDAAYASINSKRLDFAIIDRFGILRLAVDYQGHGHYRETSFMRDAVKREALRKAGVQLLEVPADFRPDDIVREVNEKLTLAVKTGASAPNPASSQSSRTT